MMPSSLRAGLRYSGMAPVMISACTTDLWQLRSTSTRSSRPTIACQTILFAVEVPLITKKVWSAPKLRAARRSASASGPVWSSSEPSSGTDTDRSERRVFSPKNWWNACPTGLLRCATPPPCPGVCQE
ncbi:hypothetical protein D3C72_1916940 [compost metagenome]